MPDMRLRRQRTPGSTVTLKLCAAAGRNGVHSAFAVKNHTLAEKMR